MDIDTRDKNAVAIDRCYNLINEITENWIKDYFKLNEDEVEWWWVADRIGEVFFINDYWFNFSDILDCYKHDISKEKMFEWYDFCLENQKVNISLAKFIISPKEKLKAEKEYLEELKQRVKSAKKELEKQLNKYKTK